MLKNSNTKISKEERVKHKNAKYYSKNRDNILNKIFFRNIRQMKTTRPNRHTVKNNGLTLDKILELKKEALLERSGEEDVVEKYYQNLYDFVEKISRAPK